MSNPTEDSAAAAPEPTPPEHKFSPVPEGFEATDETVPCTCCDDHCAARVLRSKSDHNYRLADCPHCGLVVRPLSLDFPHAI